MSTLHHIAMSKQGCSSWSVSNTGQLIIHKNGEPCTMGGLTYVGLAEEVDRIMLKVNRTFTVKVESDANRC